MATTPEGKVKKRVKEILKELGAYYVMPVTGGYGNSGVPDFVVCYRGIFFGIETKAKGGKVTALQLKNLREIQESGGQQIVVNEDNIVNLKDFLEIASYISVSNYKTTEGIKNETQNKQH